MRRGFQKLLRYESDNGQVMRPHAQLIGGLRLDLHKTLPASDRDPLIKTTNTPYQTIKIKFFGAGKSLAKKPKKSIDIAPKDILLSSTKLSQPAEQLPPLLKITIESNSTSR
jgi:hypothetical protein